MALESRVRKTDLEIMGCLGFVFLTIEKFNVAIWLRKRTGDGSETDRDRVGAKVAKIFPDLKVRNMQSPYFPLRRTIRPSFDLTCMTPFF